MTTGPFAAVDCGTNSTRLLIVDDTGSRLVEELRITSLGRGATPEGGIAADAIGRTVVALGEYRALIDAHHVTSVRAVATSAARDAVNSAHFRQYASEALGHEIEIISGDAEARLAHAGTISGLGSSAASANLVLVDIGGGSTEVVMSLQGTAGQAVSFDIGSVRLCEALQLFDQVDSEKLQEAHSYVKAVFEGLEFDWQQVADAELVATGGTATTLAAIASGQQSYSYQSIHNVELTRYALDRVTHTLAGQSVEERSQHPLLPPGRAEVIVAGAAILQVVFDWLGKSSCRVTGADILDGLILSLRS